MKQIQLGHTIAILRRTKGLTQDALAKACGINVRTLQRIEGGEVSPRVYTLKQISNQLDYDLLAEINPELIDDKKFWWEFGQDDQIPEALKIGWISGILYGLLSIPEIALLFWRFTDHLDTTGNVLYTLVNLAVIGTGILFYRGFAAMGYRIGQSLIAIAAYTLVFLIIGFYGFDIYSIWKGEDYEFMLFAELWLFGIATIVFGIGLARAESTLGSAAKIAAILDIITGVCLVLVVTAVLGAILMLPAIIAEVFLLYRAYQLFGGSADEMAIIYK